MSSHPIRIDLTAIAFAIQAIRAQLDILEKTVEEALLEENKK